MNFYEMIVIINPELDDTAVEEILQKLKDVIARQSGEILKVDTWGRRKMAYELNKQSKGHYTLITFKAPPPTILEIEKLCKLIDLIIKFMVVKLTNKKQIQALSVPEAENVQEAAAPEKPETDQPAATEQEAAPAEGE